MSGGPRCLMFLWAGVFCGDLVALALFVKRGGVRGGRGGVGGWGVSAMGWRREGGGGGGGENPPPRGGGAGRSARSDGGRGGGAGPRCMPTSGSPRHSSWAPVAAASSQNSRL